MIPSNHLIPCHLLLLLPSIFPSIRVFSNVLALRFLSTLAHIWLETRDTTQELQNGHGSCPWGAHRHLDGLKLFLLQMCHSEQERIILVDGGKRCCRWFGETWEDGWQVILGSGNSRVYSKSKGSWALLLIRLLNLKSWEGLGPSVMQGLSDRTPSVKWEWWYEVYLSPR